MTYHWGEYTIYTFKEKHDTSGCCRKTPAYGQFNVKKHAGKYCKWQKEHKGKWFETAENSFWCGLRRSFHGITGNIVVETDVYYSGEGLCQKLVAGECYDLIFLVNDLTLSGNLIRCQNGHLFSCRRYGTVCLYCNIETAAKEKIPEEKTWKQAAAKQSTAAKYRLITIWLWKKVTE